MRRDGKGDRAAWMTPAFELSGGALCLDLANTHRAPPAEGAEPLSCYRELLAWAVQADALEAGEAEGLALAAARHPRRAEAVLRRAVSLRAAIHRLFAARATGSLSRADDLAVLNAALARALARQAVVPAAPDGFAWTWAGDSNELDRVLWPVCRSAADLLTGPDLVRVRQCASTSCAWLFLDRSRNRSRRWCDMAACGNRQKARRHYARRRAAR